MAKSNSQLLGDMDNHQLYGKCVRGRWTFTCPDFPEIPKQFNGADTYVKALVAFQRRCLIGGVTAKRVNGHA